ncbi:MAG: DUF882 domain-containing protein [Gammaproteobacteria bacterium]
MQPPHRSAACAHPRINRRRLLTLGLGLAAGAVMPAWAHAALRERRLAFDHLHTGERIDVTYYTGGRYDDAALAAINHLLRDFRSGEVFPIEVALLDQLSLVHAALGADAPFQVISGFRSPATNAMLRKTSSGVAKRSLHMDGKAIDVRLADTRTARLRDAAARLKLGGVGYYGKSDFVHLDVGRPRQW